METLNKYFKEAKNVYYTRNTLAEYVTKYTSFKEGREVLKASLNKKTVKILKNVLGQLGQWSDSRDKKADLIEKIIDAVESYFLLDVSVSYVWGEKTHDEAYYDKREAKKQEQEKAVANPQTLAEFREFIRVKGLKALTTEQIEAFEKLKADVVLKRQQEEEQKALLVSKVELKNTEFELFPTKHSKTGEDIFTVVISDRVDRDKFRELRGKAKSLGGYYSRYTDKSANPPIKAGFVFKTEEEASKFMGLKEKDQVQEETKKESSTEKAAQPLPILEVLCCTSEITPPKESSLFTYFSCSLKSDTLELQK